MASRALAVRLTANTDGLSAGLTKGTREVRSFATQVESVGQRAAGLFGGLGGAIAGAMGVAGIGSALGFGVKLAADAEQARVAFTTMLGSAEQAKTVLGDLTQFAAATPFEFPELRDGARKLLAFGVGTEELIPTMRRLGDVAAGVGTPIGELAELYGKAKVQGRMMAEDINQLTGRGIPIIQELARQFGVNESQVRKLVETGQVGFPQIEEAFRSLTGEGSKFGGMMDAQSQTLAGLWSTFKDNVGLALRGVGEELVRTFDMKALLGTAIGMAENLGSALVGVARELAPFVSLAVRLGPALLAARGAVAAVNLVIRTYTSLQKAAAAATIVTQAVMGPAGWIKVAAGIAAAGIAIAGMNALLDTSSAKAAESTAAVDGIGKKAAALNETAAAGKRLSEAMGKPAVSAGDLGKQIEAFQGGLQEALGTLGDRGGINRLIYDFLRLRDATGEGVALRFSGLDVSQVALDGEAEAAIAATRDRLWELMDLPGALGQSAGEAFRAFDAAAVARERLDDLAAAFDAGEMSIEAWEAAQRDLGAATAEYLLLARAQEAAIEDLQARIQGAIDTFGSVEEAFKFGQKIQDELRTPAEEIDTLAQKIQALVDLGMIAPELETDALAGQLEKVFGEVKTPEAFDAARRKLEELQAEGMLAADQVANLMGGLADGFDKALGGPAKFIEELAGKARGLAEHLSDTQQQIEEFAATPGVTQQQIGQMRALADEVERLQKLDKLTKTGEALTKQFASPAEKLKAEAADLAKMLEVGAIDRTTAVRAFRSKASELAGSGQARSPGFATAGSREAYSAIVRQQEGRAAADPPWVKAELAKLERIAKAAEASAKADTEPLQEVDV